MLIIYFITTVMEFISRILQLFSLDHGNLFRHAAFKSELLLASGEIIKIQYCLSNTDTMLQHPIVTLHTTYSWSPEDNQAIDKIASKHSL